MQARVRSSELGIPVAKREGMQDRAAILEQPAHWVAACSAQRSGVNRGERPAAAILLFFSGSLQQALKGVDPSLSHSPRPTQLSKSGVIGKYALHVLSGVRPRPGVPGWSPRARSQGRTGLHEAF
jgi:hypothetical protein